jgi:hypothetical protein
VTTGRRAVGLAVLLATGLRPAAAAAVTARPAPGELPRPHLLWRINGVTVARHGIAASLGPKAGTILLQREPARDTISVDIRTGHMVGKPNPGPLHPAPDGLGTLEGPSRRGSVVTDGGLFWRIAGDRVEARRTRTGPAVKSLPLPAVAVGASELGLLVSAGRIAVIAPFDRVAGGFIATAARADAPQWTVLARPMTAMEFELAGDVLLAACAFDTTIAGFSLAEVDPPLAKLPAGAAVAAAKADSGSESRLLLEHLMPLPQLGPYWLEQLRRPKAELHNLSIVVMGYRPQPEALPLLLAENPRRFYGDNDALARALASQEASSAVKRLLELAKTVNGLSAVRRSGDSVFREQAYRAIWRNGRASEFGMCADARPRPVPELAKQSADGSIGTADPVIFESIAADGGWTVLCQAREDTDGDGVITANMGHHGDLYGDRMRPYLVVGSGPGMPADEFIAADPRGRFVALRDGPCLSLVDTQRRSAVTLPNADLRDDDGVFGSHRAASFDARGDRMLYLRGSITGDRLVVRTLATGREVEFDPGPGLLWRAALDPAGRWVMAELVTGPGWPQVETTLAGRSCRGDAMSYSVFGTENESPVIRRWAPVGGGRMQEIAGLIRPVASGLLVRDEAGALAIVASDGKRRAVAAADCHGRVADVEASGDGMLVVCAPPHAEQGRMMLAAGGSSTFIQMSAVPARDTWTGARDGLLVWDGNWADVARHSAAAAPPRRPDEARPATTWAEREKGILATRGDKKTELRRMSSSGSWENFVPDGPLKWVPVGASP